VVGQETNNVHKTKTLFSSHPKSQTKFINSKNSIPSNSKFKNESKHTFGFGGLWNFLGFTLHGKLQEKANNLWIHIVLI
jgi:hypothetical protein